MIVRESIDFQRKLEPKQSMDLGLVAKWMSLKKDDILLIKRDFTTDSQNHIDDESKYNTFKKGDAFDVNIGPEKYSDGTIGFTGYTSDEVVRSSDDKFVWGTPLELDQRFEILHQGLQETQNFERGQDPKKSLNIGITNILKNLLLKIKTNPPPQDIEYFSIWESDGILKIFGEGRNFLTKTNYVLEDLGLDKYLDIINGEIVDKGRTERTAGYPIKDPYKSILKGFGPTEYLNKIVNKEIYERLDFERGIDPKDSMKIGRVGERDIKKALDKLVEIRGGEYKINYIKDWGNRTPYVEGTYFMAPGYDKVFRADNLFIRYYPVQGTSEDHFSYGYRIEGKVMLEKILTTAEEGLTEILKNITPLPHDPVQEAHNFERGLDPKKAMKIGKNFLQYKKGDKVKVWVPWEKRPVEVRVYEDEELDTDGRPKIRKMISNTKPAWPVRRIWVRYNGEVRTANLAIEPDSPEQELWILHQ